MTENEINEARYINDNILPKLQEMQRDLYMNEHFCMSIEPSGYKRCITVFVHVRRSQGAIFSVLCTGRFSFSTYSDPKYQKKLNDKALRGVTWFIKNWQAILG